VVVVSRDRWLRCCLLFTCMCVCVFGRFCTFYVWTRSSPRSRSRRSAVPWSRRSLVEAEAGEGWRGVRDAWGHTTTRVAPDSIHDGAAHRAHDACVRRGETDGDDDDEDDRRQERRAPGCRRGEQGEEESRFGPIARPRERGGDALGGWIQLSRVDGTFRDSCERARARRTRGLGGDGAGARSVGVEVCAIRERARGAKRRRRRMETRANGGKYFPRSRASMSARSHSRARSRRPRRERRGVAELRVLGLKGEAETGRLTTWFL